MKRHLATVGLGVLLGYGCAAKPENGNPGVCALSCNNAVLGSSDPQFSVKSLSADIRFECPKGLTAPIDLDAVLLQFLFSEKVKINDIERERPVPYLSFEPIILGILSDFKNPENINPATNEVPQRYVGIRTPKSEWCTDSCGVASVEIEPKCLTAGLTNEITIKLHSGSLYPKDPLKLTVVTPDN